MIELGIILFFTACLVILVRYNLIQADMSLPWFLGLVVFGFLSTNDTFVDWIGAKLGILYPPIAVVFITISILLGLITVLLIAFTSMRRQQIKIIRRLAEYELGRQEESLFSSSTSKTLHQTKKQGNC